MATQQTLTDIYERTVERTLHGIKPYGSGISHTTDPSEYEVALFTAQPTADAEEDFANEISLAGYARQLVNIVPNGALSANQSDVVFDGSLITDTESQDATWVAVCKKRKMDLPFTKAYGNQQSLLLPSLAIEDVTYTTVTGIELHRGYFNANPPPPDTGFGPVAGEVQKITCDTANFPTTIGFDPFGRPNSYVIFTSGILAGLKCVVWGRINSTELLIGLPGHESGQVTKAFQVVGTSITVRKFPTLNSVFGAYPDYAPELTSGSFMSATRVTLYTHRRSGILFRNATHNQSSKTITFDALSTSEKNYLNTYLASLSSPSLRILFPGTWGNTTYMDGDWVGSPVLNTEGTQLTYTNDLTDPTYAVSTPTHLYGFNRGLYGSGVSEFVNIYPSTSGWRASDGFISSSLDIGEVALPVVDFLTGTHTHNPGLSSDTASGFRASGLFNGVSIYHVGNPDTTFTYQATKDLASEIIWTAEIQDSGGNPAPATVSSNQSIQFNQGKLKFSIK
jgi:hypothetical protein